jgi:hypothetical protein
VPSVGVGEGTWPSMRTYAQEYWNIRVGIYPRV